MDRCTFGVACDFTGGPPFAEAWRAVSGADVRRCGECAMEDAFSACAACGIAMHNAELGWVQCAQPPHELAGCEAAPVCASCVAAGGGACALCNERDDDCTSSWTPSGAAKNRGGRGSRLRRRQRQNELRRQRALSKAPADASQRGANEAAGTGGASGTEAGEDAGPAPSPSYAPAERASDSGNDSEEDGVADRASPPPPDGAEDVPPREALVLPPMAPVAADVDTTREEAELDALLEEA